MIAAIAGRARVVVFLELDDDQQRRDLGDVGDVAGDEDHRAVFADAAREGEREAGEQGRDERRQHDAQERSQPRAPSVAAASSSSGRAPRSPAGPCARRTAGRRRSARRGCPAGVGDLDAERGERRAEPAVRRIERGERDAGDRGRQREGQIDQRVERAGGRGSGSAPASRRRSRRRRRRSARRRTRRRRSSSAPPARAAPSRPPTGRQSRATRLWRSARRAAAGRSASR